MTKTQKRLAKKNFRSAAPLDHKHLCTRIADADALIGIVGMGYVGLPLMLASAAKKFRVLGFDIDLKKVKELNLGRSPLKHIPDVHIAAMRKALLFEATDDLKRLSEGDIIVICVPTPVGPHREPDLSFVINTVRAVAMGLRPGQLIVLESTTYPGTTTEIVRPILEFDWFKVGSRFLFGIFARARGSGECKIFNINNTKNCWRRLRSCS